MAPKKMIRYLYSALLLASLAGGGVTPALGVDYGRLVSQVREQLQHEHYEEAAVTARNIMRANVNDYRGHYFAASAHLGLGRLEDADAAVARAVKLVPAGARGDVEKLAATIKTRRQLAETLRAADAALADGLAGKAARLYEQVWSAGQDNPELGLKLAALYATRLNQPLDAARLLRQVRSVARGSQAAERAGTELAKLAEQLRRVARDHVKAAGRQQGAEALQSLQLAEEADPSYVKIFELRARLVAKGENAEALQSAIKELARRDLAQPKALANLPKMAQWLQQPPFSEFMTDLIGSSQTGLLRQLAQTATGEPPDLVGEFIDVPAGCFTTNGRTVCLDAFRLGEYEVTQGVYKSIMGYNPSFFGSCGDDCPVERVSWDEVQAFIARLSSETGNSYRLPTAAEWEYACRSGGKNEEYCGSANMDAVAWHAGNSAGRTHPVGRKQPNGLGIYDMNGNVWEWVGDWFDDSYPSSDKNPRGPASGSARVFLGGGWALGAAASAADRKSYPPDCRSDAIGFRLVLAAR